jgi:hypothetical protein
MNRRQFLGAQLAAAIAAFALPFERFAEWCKAWLGPTHIGEIACVGAKLADITGLWVNGVKAPGVVKVNGWLCPSS